MAHISEELAFGAGGHFRRLFSLLQRVFDLMALGDFLLQLLGALVHQDPQFLFTLLHPPGLPNIDRHSQSRQKENANKESTHSIKPSGLIEPGSQIKVKTRDLLIPNFVIGSHYLEAVVSRRKIGIALLTFASCVNPIGSEFVP